MDNDPAQAGLAVYIHWPYCARICPYCDFNVYKQRNDAGLCGAIIQDLKGWRDWSGPRHVSSIHFGGGTPSLMSAAQVQSLIETVRALWTLDRDCEIALEANPQDMDMVQADKWQRFVAAGVNRVSLGVQSFQDKALTFLGRDHNGAQARAALAMAASLFPSLSADIIYGWAGQTEALLQADLDGVLGVIQGSGVGHISAYQLTIEPETAFARAQVRGAIKAVHDDISADFYTLVQDRLTGAGFSHYEVSNYAKPGQESVHNLAYWQGRDYVGVGPGAHGRLTVEGQRWATAAARAPQIYQQRVADTRLGLTVCEALTPSDCASEYLAMGLRIDAGISIARYQALAGKVMANDLLDDLEQAELVRIDGGRLQATEKGRLLLDYITRQFHLA